MKPPRHEGERRMNPAPPDSGWTEGGWPGGITSGWMNHQERHMNEVDGAYTLRPWSPSRSWWP